MDGKQDDPTSWDIETTSQGTKADPTAQVKKDADAFWKSIAKAKSFNPPWDYTPSFKDYPFLPPKVAAVKEKYSKPYDWSWDEKPITMTCALDAHTSCSGKLLSKPETKCHCECHTVKCPKCENMMPSNTVLDPTAANAMCVACKTPFCDGCGLCHKEDCLLVSKRVISKSDLLEMGHLMAATQKAKGYAIIAKALNVPKPFRVIMDEADIDSVIAKMNYTSYNGLFVRPCPVRPRHGFVESRGIPSGHLSEVTTKVREIFREARAADPEAELLVVPTIPAEFNVILTPTRMAVGVGNDGATAGKKSAAFPLTGVRFHELTPQLITQAGVNAETEDPYIETVLTSEYDKVYDTYTPRPINDVVFFTQLRAGVRIPPAVDKDFIPDRIVVEGVVEASGDLLEWERQVKEEIKPGTVVYHLGGTLVSHYGVHCVFNNIPILTSRKPEVGEMLIPTAKPERPAPNAVVRGLAIGAGKYVGIEAYRTKVKDDHLTKMTSSQAATYMLMAAHNATALGGEDGTWLGIAAAFMLRLGMAASHGEARYKDNYTGGRLRREEVYELAINDFFPARDTIGHAYWRFTELSWESGFGGEAWGTCTEAIMRLEKAARLLIQSPTDEAVTELVTALHSAINQAHNGGWWLNKFVGKTVFDETSVQSLYSLAVSAPAVLKLANLIVDEGSVQEFLEQWKVAPDPDTTKGISVSGLEHKDRPIEDQDDEDDQDDEVPDDSYDGGCQCSWCLGGDEESEESVEDELEPSTTTVLENT